LEVTVNVPVLLAAALTFKVVAETVIVGVIACVMVTVCDVTPVPEIVTVAFRAAVVVLSVAVNVIVPLFIPEAGLKVSQVWLLTAVQPILEVTVIVPVVTPAFIFNVDGETAKLAGVA
jgi:hypothetical protein